VRRHLARWLPRFAQEVLTEARLPRYRLAAGLLLRLLAVEGELFKPARPIMATEVRQAA
jgi:TorA maturation chaperone TorD